MWGLATTANTQQQLRHGRHAATQVERANHRTYEGHREIEQDAHARRQRRHAVLTAFRMDPAREFTPEARILELRLIGFSDQRGQALADERVSRVSQRPSRKTRRCASTSTSAGEGNSGGNARKTSRQSKLPRLTPCISRSELHARETFEVENPDLFAVRIDKAVLLKFRKHAADGFEFHPEIAADLLARHA